MSVTNDPSQISAFSVYNKTKKRTKSPKSSNSDIFLNGYEGNTGEESEELASIKHESKDKRELRSISVEENRNATPKSAKKAKETPKSGAKKRKVSTSFEENTKEENEEVIVKRKFVNEDKQRRKLKNFDIKKDENQAPNLVNDKGAPKKIVKKTKKLDSYESSDDPSSESLKLFKWLIGPHSSESFFSGYWEKQPLHIIRKAPSYYSHILRSSDLDKMLRDNPLYYTKNVDVVSYENGEKQTHNKEGRAVPSALWDYYSNGCSIRVLNPQTYNYKVRLLISTLEEYFGAMVGANVYLTPPNSQGFAPHYDDIEAFVVQLEGTKKWKLYKPKPSDVLARYSSPNFSSDEIGEPFMELTLESGDLLYFPRGTIHEGSTGDSHSLHITISVYQNTSYIDLMEHIVPQALKRASEENLEFRRGLPLNYLKHLGAANQDKNSSVKEEVIGKVKQLCASLAEYLDVDEGVDQLGQKFICDSMPPVPSKGEIERTSRGDGDYLSSGKVFNRVEMGLDTKVRLLRYHCIRLVVNPEESPKLYYNTENANVYRGEDEQWLELDESMIELIRGLQISYPSYVAIEDLPMSDQIVKLQLISDLWEHGLVVTKDRLECIV